MPVKKSPKKSPMKALPTPVSMPDGPGTAWHTVGDTGFAKSDSNDFVRPVRSVRFNAVGKVKMRDIHGTPGTLDVVAGEVWNQCAIAGIFATVTTVANADIVVTE